MINWEARIYNESDPGDLNTLYGQLARIATNRAVYLSIIKMTEENNIQPGELVINFITDGYSADLVMSIRRLVELNGTKPIHKQVNSIMGLVESIENDELLGKIKNLSSSLGDVPNKVYGHNDLLYSQGEKELNMASYNHFHQAIKDLHSILIEAAENIGVFVPTELVATNQFDWAAAFDKPWRAKGFDDSEIWFEL